MTAERAPEAPGRGWSGWSLRAAPYVRTHPSGPVLSPAGSLPGAPRANPGSWPIRARFHVFLVKHCQNRGVSPKCVEKASVSPCFQNGLGKSPLRFLRFPYSPAFSHKELSGHFDPYSRLLVKMTKCRPNVHPMYPRSGRSDTPTDPASKLAPGVGSSSELARSPGGILNGSIIYCFAPDYD